MGQISYQIEVRPLNMLVFSCIMSLQRTVTWTHVWLPAVCSLEGVKAADSDLNIYEGVNVAVLVVQISCRNKDWVCLCQLVAFPLTTHIHTQASTHAHTHNRIIWEWKSVAQKGSRAQGWRKVELVSCWSKPVAGGDASHRRQRCNCTAWWDLCLHNNFSAILH